MASSTPEPYVNEAKAGDAAANKAGLQEFLRRGPAAITPSSNHVDVQGNVTRAMPSVMQKRT